MKKILLFVCALAALQTRTVAQYNLPEIGLAGPSYRAMLYVVPDKALPGVRTMAVLPFDGINTYYTLDQKFGSQIADKLTEILQIQTRGAQVGKIYSNRLATNVYKMVDRTQVQRIIDREQIRSTEGAIDQGSVVKLGGLLSAQAFITGTFILEPKPVTQSTTKNKEGKITSYSISRSVVLRLTMKITKVETGEPLVFTFERTNSDSKSSDSGYPSERTLETVDNLAFKVIDGVVDNMCNLFSPYYSNQTIDLEKSQNKDQRDLFKQAFDYLDNGDLAGACSIFNSLYQQDKYNAQLNFNIGAVYLGAGNYAKAAEWFDKAYKLSNQSEKGYGRYKQAALDLASKTALLKSWDMVLVETDYCEQPSGGQGAPTTLVSINGSQKDPALIFEQMGSGGTPEVIRSVIKVKKINVKDNWFEVEMPTGERRFVEAKFIK